MRRVLFLAYHFPPIGGAGVQRSLKFTRYLPEFGYQPIVVTGPGTGAGRWTPLDDTLLEEIPEGTEVLRLPSPPPANSGWRRRAERWLPLETAFARWWGDGTRALARRVPNVDLVFASMSPFESAEAAAAVARDLDRPWVADLRDPWALDEMVIYPTALHRRLDLSRMQRLLATASAVVMNTPEAAREVRRRIPALAGVPVAAIPNGFDQADFTGPAPDHGDSTFRIVHTGYLHTELGEQGRAARIARRVLGGAPAGVDVLTRSHVYLLRAVERLIARDYALADRLEVHLAGVLSPADIAVVRRELSRPELVRSPGYLSHRDSIALTRSADLLFLPMHDLPPGTRSRIVPGKTYEYLAAERPILAAVPDGDARDLLARAGAHLCRPADVEAMTGVIAQEIRQAGGGRSQAADARELLGRFERKNLTRELAGVFSQVLAGDLRDRPPLEPRAAAGMGRG